MVVARPVDCWNWALVRLGREVSSASRFRLTTAALVLTGFAIMLLRRPMGLSGSFLWAEDGTVFLAGGPDNGLGALASPYNGQLWLVQRLLGFGVTLAPPQSWPLIAYVASCAVCALVLSVVLTRRAAQILGPLPVRAVAYLALLAQPLAQDVQGNISNLHVWLGVGLAVTLTLPGPTHRWARVVELAVIFVVATAGMLGVLFLPVAIWRWLTFRDSTSLRRLLVLGTGATLNVVAALADHRDSGFSSDTVRAAGIFIVKRFAGGVFLAEPGQVWWWQQGLHTLWLVPALVVLLLIGRLLWVDRRGPSPWWFLAGLGWLGAGLLVAPPWLGQSEIAWSPDAAGRLLSMLVAITILIGVRGWSLGARKSAGALGAFLACGLALGYIVSTPGASSPITVETRTAFAECIAEEEPVCSMPILPIGWVLTRTGPD